jgi:hypothetical protein
MINSLSSFEKTELQASPSDGLRSQMLHKEIGCERTAGPLSIKIPFSENVSKPVSPAENEYGVLYQSSPSSEVSFGWEEITENTNLISRCSSYGIESRNSPVNESSNSYKKWNRTTEDSDSVSSTEHTLLRDVGCLDVTAVSKGESNFREDNKFEAHTKYMTIKPVLSENLVRDICRMKKTHRMSESEDSESDSTCHFRRESVNSQKLVLESPASVKLVETSCIEKNSHDVSRREESGSDSTEDFAEVKQTNRMKTYS